MNSLARAGLLAALLLGLQPCGADELGRLFFTPAQRAQLDREKPAAKGTGASRRTLTVNGIVQKHGGARTVWINGVAQSAGGADDRTPESVPVALPGQKQPVKVKVGEKVPLPPPGQ